MAYCFYMTHSLFSVLAHSGHPALHETHGDATHLILGLAVALVFAAGAFGWSRRREPVRVREHKQR